MMDRTYNLQDKKKGNLTKQRTSFLRRRRMPCIPFDSIEIIFVYASRLASKGEWGKNIIISNPYILPPPVPVLVEMAQG
jgi:hypothetical protein